MLINMHVLKIFDDKNYAILNLKTSYKILYI